MDCGISLLDVKKCVCVYLLPSCRSLHLFLLKRAVSSVGTIVPMGLFPHTGENLD